MALLQKAVPTLIADDGLARRKARRAERLVARVKSQKSAKAAANDEVADSDSEAPARAPARDKKSKTDGSGYLSLYFRDMQALHVLRPEEEFTAAREIEALEVMLWETILAFPASHELVLDTLDELDGHAASRKAM